MGYYSDLDIDFREQGKDPNIAHAIGVSYEELLEIDYEFYTERTKSGAIKYYRLVLSKDVPENIKNKIFQIEQDGITVFIKPDELKESIYQQYEFESILQNDKHLEKFKSELSNLTELSRVNTNTSNLNELLQRQIYIGIIGSLEVFLSEVFIVLTLNNEEYFKSFIKNYPDFSKRKFTLNEIFTEYDRIRETAKNELLSIIYHNLSIVKNMYKATFKIEFPEISTMSKHINIRHDLVHRNGETKEGKKIVVNKIMNELLINDTIIFVDQISENLGL